MKNRRAFNRAEREHDRRAYQQYTVRGRTGSQGQGRRTISLSDLAAAVKNESRTERGKTQKKPSIRAQLKADKDMAAKKQEAKNKNLEREV